MATSPPNSNQVDRLSNLPDALLVSIVWLLPTHMAARSAVLARRFRHFWEASPALHFDGRRCRRYLSFVAMADHALLRRNPSHSLLSLRVDIPYWAYSYTEPPCVSFIPSLISKATSLGLRHLTLDGLDFSCFFATLPIIFSSTTLQSLCLCHLPSYFPPSYQIPSGITLTALTSLSLRLYRTAHAKFNRLISELPSLDDLYLEICYVPEINISSNTITKLKLIIDLCTREINVVTLSIPSLHSLHVELIGCRCSSFMLPRFQGEIPLLRRAVISHVKLVAGDVNAVTGLLKYISHAEELVLHVKEDTDVTGPVPIMFIPKKDALNFFNLKHLDVTAAFISTIFKLL